MFAAVDFIKFNTGCYVNQERHAHSGIMKCEQNTHLQQYRRKHIPKSIKHMSF